MTSPNIHDPHNGFVRNRGEFGVALLLDLAGRVTEVLRDDFGMLADALDKEGRLPENALFFTDFVQEGSRDKARNFLERIRSEGVAFQWEFIVGDDKEAEQASTPYHFAGGMLCNQIMVLGAPTPDMMSRLYNDFISLTLEQAAQLRQAVSGPGMGPPKQSNGDKGEALYEEFSRLNNELVNAQRALHKKNSELERLNREKNLFIGMAAHDLRNPLGIILSYGEFIGEALAGDCMAMDRSDCESLQEMVAAIVNSSGFMLGMVDELLNVSRIEAGRIELNLQEVDLVGLFEHNVTLNRVLAEHHGVFVQFRAASRFPMVTVDPNKMTQVLNNLIANAVRHSPQGGTVQIDLDRDDGHAIIKVKDQGPGVAEVDRESIFQPYVQLQEGGKGKGAGLGLAIVKRIVEGHNGAIWVTGEPDEGATFHVRFPFGTRVDQYDDDEKSFQESTQDDFPQDAEQPVGPLRVLVADDEPLNRTLIERILTAHGHEVFTAEDGDIALDAAEREKPDVLVLDMSMPTMDGLDVLRIIRSGQRDIPADTPVIVLTGFAKNEVDEACNKYGVAAIVTKPISMDKLLTMLSRVVARKGSC